MKLNIVRFLTVTAFLLVGVNAAAGLGTCPETGGFSDFTSTSATVAIHVSENTAAAWSTLGGPHEDWPRPWHIYGFLMEQLRADGTPFDVVTDADIVRGKLMLAGGAPRYAIMFSLANDCVSDAAAERIESFVRAGGHAFVGSTSWTRNERCQLRGDSIYIPTHIGVSAENDFSPEFHAGNTIDANCDNLWINSIDDRLPTSITFIPLSFREPRRVSRVGIVQSNYERRNQVYMNQVYTYRMRDFDVKIAADSRCADRDFRPVRSGTLRDVSGDYQEFGFPAETARCVRIVARSSYERTPYPGADTRQWVGLSGVQIFEAETGRPLIQNPCIPLRPFALASQMGLTFGALIKRNDFRRTGVADNLVSHLPNDNIRRNWALAVSFDDSTFAHGPHWVQSVAATTATVLATTGDNFPILTVKNYGAGRFIYHSEFNPLAGYTMHTVASHVYGFYRTAINQAHAARGLPNVRLGAWPYPYVAAFMTRHDHTPNFGFNTTPDRPGCSRVPRCTKNCCEDHSVAEIEHRNGVRGSYFLRTGPGSRYRGALPSTDRSAPCPVGDTDCDRQITDNLAYMANELGALFGSHTLDEDEEPLDGPGRRPVGESLDRLQRHLPLRGGVAVRPTIFVTPGARAILDETIKGLSDAGITSTGDIAYGAHPHFALRMASTEYGNRARFSIIEIPATSYFGPVIGGPGFGGGIWSHQISSNPPNCNNDGTHTSGMGIPCMHKAVGLMYRLGGLINLYDHIGDEIDFFRDPDKHNNPTAADFEEYIRYAQRQPDVWTTNTVDIESWWSRRDQVRVSHSYTKTPTPRVTVILSCANDAGPFSVNVALPWVGSARVMVNGFRATFKHSGSDIRIIANSPSTIVITQPR